MCVYVYDCVRASVSGLLDPSCPRVDLVGTNILVELADEISGTVADLFNKSLRSGEVPQIGNWLTFHRYLKKGRNQVCPIIDLLV